MKLQLTILVAPKPKERARTIRQGNKIMSFTPHKTAHVQNIIRDKLLESNVFFPVGAPLKLVSRFYIERPKSAPKKRKYPTVYPDLDNMEKLLMDSLQGFAFPNDSQVVWTDARKLYGSPPRIEFTLTEIEEE